jgi:hypothetical protein
MEIRFLGNLFLEIYIVLKFCGFALILQLDMFPNKRQNVNSFGIFDESRLWIQRQWSAQFVAVGVSSRSQLESEH